MLDMKLTIYTHTYTCITPHPTCLCLQQQHADINISWTELCFFSPCNDCACALTPGDGVLKGGHNSWLYVFIIKICDTGILPRIVMTEIIPCIIPFNKD